VLVSALGGDTLLGRYRVLRRLGAGGMATVFLAEDERLRRQVAVKRLHADSAEAVARRFEREARVGASLNHPNIVAVYDTDTDAEGVVIVMEYVEGETLAAALRRGPLEPRRALAAIGDVAAALDHAHRAGVIHRDVKPANVLLGDGDVVKLADLGIAQAAEQTHLTATGTVLGTASYMAPEQLEGSGVGPEADTYALAAVAYEAFSGRRAREGATPVAIAHSVISEPPPDLRRAWPAAPPAAAQALARGMDRNPAARQRSPGELARELSEAVESGLLAPAAASTEPMAAPEPEPRRHAPPAAPPPRPAPTTIHRARTGRGRIFAARAAAALGVILVGAVIVALVAGGGGQDGDAAAPAEEPTANDGAASSGGGPGTAAPAPAPAPEEPAPEEPAPEPADTPLAAPDGVGDPAEGAALNDEGKALIDDGRPEEAVPVLQEAVQSFPEDTTDVNYAYSLFNLGNALRLAGRPDEAIPVLERRLEIPNQRSAVREELELARTDAE